MNNLYEYCRQNCSPYPNISNHVQIVCTNVPEYIKILHPFVQENNRTKISVEDQASDAVISIGSNPTPLLVDIGKASASNAET